MKKIILMLFIGANMSFGGGGALQHANVIKATAQIISPILSAQPNPVAQGSNFTISWNAPWQGSYTGCYLKVDRVLPNGQYVGVFNQGVNTSGSKTIHNAKLKKYIVNFRCHIKYKGVKKVIKVINVKPVVHPVKKPLPNK